MNRVVLALAVCWPMLLPQGVCLCGHHHFSAPIRIDDTHNASACCGSCDDDALHSTDDNDVSAPHEHIPGCPARTGGWQLMPTPIDAPDGSCLLAVGDTADDDAWMFHFPSSASPPMTTPIYLALRSLRR
jgi:hypothetical protein